MLLWSSKVRNCSPIKPVESGPSARCSATASMFLCVFSAQLLSTNVSSLSLKPYQVLSWGLLGARYFLWRGKRSGARGVPNADGWDRANGRVGLWGGLSSTPYPAAKHRALQETSLPYDLQAARALAHESMMKSAAIISKNLLLVSSNRTRRMNLLRLLL